MKQTISPDLKDILAPAFSMPTMAPGLPIESYHAHPNLGSTTLGRARRSWAHALVPFEGTKATAFGGAFHVLAGEPQLFPRLFARGPSKEDYVGLLVTKAEIDARIKEINKDQKIPRDKPSAIKILQELDPSAQIWDAIAGKFYAENAGKTIVTAEEWEQMNGMLESLIKHKNALKLLTGGVAETSFFCIDKESGVGIKCRPDYYRSNGDIIDIKTAEDASASGFAATLGKYGRHIQTALYLDVVSEVTGKKHDTFLHLVIEKKPPYAIGIYRACPDTIEQGRREYKKLLTQYAYCKAIGEFPAYSEEIETVSMRSWEFGNDY